MCVVFGVFVCVWFDVCVGVGGFVCVVGVCVLGVCRVYFVGVRVCVECV